MCKERESFLEKYTADATAYRAAVERMKDLNGQDFQRAWDDSEELLEEREATRQALADHEREHGCLRERPAASIHREAAGEKTGT